MFYRRTAGCLLMRATVASLQYSAAEASMGKGRVRPPGPQKKKTMDEILGDVMHEAMKERDRGGKPDMNFVYKRAQDKMFEAEYGHPPPSKSQNYKAHIPFVPLKTTRRIVPLTMFDDDPWPQRSFAPEEGINDFGEPIKPPKKSIEESWDDDVVPRPGVKEDEGGKGAEEQKPAISHEEASSMVTDAIDECSFWEIRLLEFLRNVPVSQRRSLPIFVEMYKHLVHRLLRAERHFLKARDAAVVASKAKLDVFAETEKLIERFHMIYIETHKSLTHVNYDPRKMKKSVTGKLLEMDNAQWEAWKAAERTTRNQLIAALSSS